MSMTKQDETELRRLSHLLGEIDAALPPKSPLREGIAKAGVALGLAFISGKRAEVEAHYEALSRPA